MGLWSWTIKNNSKTSKHAAGNFRRRHTDSSENFNLHFFEKEGFFLDLMYLRRARFRHENRIFFKFNAFNGKSCQIWKDIFFDFKVFKPKKKDIFFTEKILYILFKKRQFLASGGFCGFRSRAEGHRKRRSSGCRWASSHRSWGPGGLRPWEPRLRETLFVTWRTFDGPFSAVSTATIARVGAFFRIFRDLQDLHSFAPLRYQNFSKKSSKCLTEWKKMKFHIIRVFRWILRVFGESLMKFCRNFT